MPSSTSVAFGVVPPLAHAAVPSDQVIIHAVPAVPTTAALPVGVPSSAQPTLVALRFVVVSRMSVSWPAVVTGTVPRGTGVVTRGAPERPG